MRAVTLAEFIYHNIIEPEYPDVIRVKFGKDIPVSIWTALKTDRWSSLVRVSKIGKRYLFCSNKPINNDNNNLEDNQMATNKNQNSDNNDSEKDFYDSLRNCFTGDKFSSVADSVKITAVQGVVLESYLKTKEEMGVNTDEELKAHILDNIANSVLSYPMVEIKQLMDKEVLTAEEIKGAFWVAFVEHFFAENNLVDEDDLKLRIKKEVESWKQDADL